VSGLESGPGLRQLFHSYHNLTHHYIEQNCRLFAALLVATQDGSFGEGSPAERERLLRVLAYVRKDDDAIPDYKPEGLTDDQREMRAATVALDRLIQGFKAWRLGHQVPIMWPNRDDVNDDPLLSVSSQPTSPSSSSARLCGAVAQSSKAFRHSLPLWP
jgi:hypothetical protein